MSDTAIRLLIVGGGNMGAALLGGLLGSGWAAATELAIVEVDEARRTELAEKFPGVTVIDAVVAAHGAVIAVKPHDVPLVARELANHGVERIVSIAAGVTIETITDAAGSPVRVIRAMPNTPALVGAGAAALAAGGHADEDDLQWAETVLSSVGTTVRVPERLLDAVTGLSASGPAYVFLVAEALIEAGVLVGLPRATSHALVTQLFVGSAKLLAESGDTPDALRASVTSPGGTTAAGLRALERAGVRAAFLDAVAAATDRAHELGAQ